MVKRASELKSGECGKVTSIDRQDALGIRLQELGLIPGTPVRFIRLASHKGPMEIFVRGYNLTLGLKEAESIWVRTDIEA